MPDDAITRSDLLDRLREMALGYPSDVRVSIAEDLLLSYIGDDEITKAFGEVPKPDGCDCGECRDCV